MKHLVLLYREPRPGQADDEDVKAQANWIRTCLQPRGWDVRELAWPETQSWPDFIPALQACQPEVVFNLVEGWPGDDRLQALVPGLLETSGWAYTGSSLPAILTTTDKILAKAVMQAEGILTPAWGIYRGAPWVPPFFPCICKPAWTDASLGIDDDAILYSPEESQIRLPQRWSAAGKQPLLVEAYLEGREFNVSLRERSGGSVEVLPPAELCFEDWPTEKPRIVNYRAKWDPETFEYHHTQRRFIQDADLAAELKRVALACWRAFRPAGYARVDFRQDAQGNLYVLEMNTNPCLAPDAGFMAAVEQAGYSAAGVLEDIVQAALRRKELGYDANNR
jgi:D-alanine-D-alanine ligase